MHYPDVFEWASLLQYIAHPVIHGNYLLILKYMYFFFNSAFLIKPLDKLQRMTLIASF